MEILECPPSTYKDYVGYVDSCKLCPTNSGHPPFLWTFCYWFFPLMRFEKAWNMGAPNSVHKLPRVSFVFCILRTILRPCEKFNIVVKTYKYSHKINVEMNCTYVNLGLLLPFLRNLGSIHGQFVRFLRLIVCSVLFSYIKRSRWLCAVSTHKSLPHQRTAHRFTMKVPNLLRSGQSLISSHRHGCWMCFLRENIWKALGSGQSGGVRSGITTTTCCRVNKNI